MTKKQNAATEKLQDGKGTPAKEKTTEKQTTLLKLENKKSVEKKNPTLEDLKKENEALKKQLSAIPNDLDGKISFYKRKQELIKRLNKMQANEKVLLMHKDSLLEHIQEKNDFSSDTYFLKVCCKPNYSENDIFEFNNPEIISEVIDFVLNKIDAKKKKLQAEINA